MIDSAEGLADFIDLLEETLDWEFNIDSFEDRVKIQKYIYLAEAYGLNHGYHFNLYIRGPYSPVLADDYYNLPRAGSAEDLSDFDRSGFFDLIRGRDSKWLEVAATTFRFLKRYHSQYSGELLKEKVIRRVCRAKNTNPGYVRAIYDELTRTLG